MRSLARLWPIVLVSGLASCAFLLDFDELQSGSEDAGADASVGGTGGTGGSGGTPTGGSAGAGGAGGTAGVAGSAGAGGDASTGVPIEKLAAELAKALCDNANTCYGPAIDIVTQGLDCVALYEVGLEDTIVGMVQKSVADNTIQYDAVAAAKCIADLNALTQQDASAIPNCVDSSKYFEQCKFVFSKLGDAGSSCTHTLECADGLYCDSSTSCPGTCTPYVSDGGPCEDTKQCKAGSVCFTSTDTGDAGNAGDAGDAGDGGAASDAGTGTCQPYTPLLGTCNVWVPTAPPCAPGTICSGGQCRLAQTYFSNGPTAECGGFLGGKNLCGAGLSCEFKGIPLLSDGDCVSDVDHALCKVSVPDSCGPGKYCNAATFATGSCANLPKNDGDPCAKDAQQGYAFAPPCGDGLRCVNGICKTVARVNQPCINNAHCGSGICDNAPDAAGTDAGMGTCVLPQCY